MATAGLSWWLGLALAPTLGGQLLAVSPWLALVGGASLAASIIVLLRAFEPALPAGVRSIPRPDGRSAFAPGSSKRDLDERPPCRRLAEWS